MACLVTAGGYPYMTAFYRPLLPITLASANVLGAELILLFDFILRFLTAYKEQDEDLVYVTNH